VLPSRPNPKDEGNVKDWKFKHGARFWKYVHFLKTLKALTKAKLAYSVLTKEFYEIKCACTYLRPQTTPVQTEFLFVTDHQLFSWIFSEKTPTSRLLKWTVRLEENDYQKIYCIRRKA
jgi:hypothetical protein